MRRRGFIAGGFAVLTGAGGTQAQQAGQVHRIGVLTGGSAPPASRPAPLRDAFVGGLRDLGWVDGQNVNIEWRFAGGGNERLRDLAAELSGMKVAVLVALGGRAAAAAKETTRTIPIVMLASDPVGGGLVASLGRPGTNVTGLSHLPASWSKWLELLKEGAPRLTRIAVLSDPSNPSDAHAWSELQNAAPRLRVTVERHVVRGGDDVDRALHGTHDTGEDGLFVPPDPLFLVHRKRIVERAARNRLPAMYGFREHVEIGGLMAYAPSFPDLVRRMATFVDKILKGRAPADLPIEQPERFYLVINLKTANALALTIAPSLLLRADDIIQ